MRNRVLFNLVLRPASSQEAVMKSQGLTSISAEHPLLQETGYRKPHNGDAAASLPFLPLPASLPTSCEPLSALICCFLHPDLCSL